jgi:hypothetical protein
MSMTKEQRAKRLEAQVEATQQALHNARIMLRSSHVALCGIRESLASAAEQLEYAKGHK